MRYGMWVEIDDGFVGKVHTTLVLSEKLGCEAAEGVEFHTRHKLAVGILFLHSSNGGAELGYEIIGVSKDKQELQKKFADAQGLEFPLIADTSTELLQTLGAWGEKVACGRRTIGTLRTTYLVNEEGIIERIFTPKEIKTKIHAEQILNVIK